MDFNAQNFGRKLVYKFKEEIKNDLLIKIINFNRNEWNSHLTPLAQKKFSPIRELNFSVCHLLYSIK